MRVNKDGATQFIDAKIAQFKEMETALDEGTFSSTTLVVSIQSACRAD